MERFPKAPLVVLAIAFALAPGHGVFASPAPATAALDARAKLPWATAGLTERQAAAHLLDRFAFGPRPGDIDRLVEQGLEAWLEAQLAGTVDDAGLAERTRKLDAWGMPASEIARTFPPYIVLRREAMEAGLVDRSMAAPLPGEPTGKGQAADQRRAILELYRERGYRSQRELLGQLVSHKLIEAAHSERQLEAVLADFWFNHFNVSTSDNQARGHLLSFERDAIAPGVLGRFDDLLAEVAAHPAMLLYLDNAQSTANPDAVTTLDRRMQASGMGAGRPPGGGMSGPMGQGGARGGAGAGQPAREERRPPANRSRGLNENFARELLELHTLGVDGGYTQEDVVAVARAFTGWTVLPPGGLGEEAARRMRRVAGTGGLGFVERSGFLFRADAHDAEPKQVLGKKLPGGRGIEDGLDVLELVAHHPATARHLASKLAARFVADEPPPELVDRLAQVFLASDGDLRAVTRSLAYSQEFWSPSARGRKIKSPFELAMSAVRALGGEVAALPVEAAPMLPDSPARRPAGPASLAEWIGRMGQPLYAYQAPTGYPDRAEAWVSTGSLLTRMSFGLHLAASRIPGVSLDLAALALHREPESLEQALAIYAGLLLPERDLAETVRRLEPVARDADLGGRVERAAAQAPPAGPAVAGGMADGAGARVREDGTLVADAGVAGASPLGATDPVQHVVGVILGSPEFQRR